MRTKKGIVTSAKMQDTVTVIVHRHAFHPLYQKRFRKSSKFLADCKGIEDLQEGDAVVIVECKPLSKRKYFRVTEVTNRVPRVSEMAEEQEIEKAIHREKMRGQGSVARDQESAPSPIPDPGSLSSDEQTSDDAVSSPMSTS